ncbi:MAG: hypothetical protein R3F19_19915 [Verrucomicrobiales bacterium]
MKTVINNSIVAAGLLAITGISTLATADAGERNRRGGSSIYSEVRTLDILTDRLHTIAKRDLKRSRDSKRIIALICDLETRADRMRSGVENRAAFPVINRLAESVEESARSVTRSLSRRPANCELNKLAFTTLNKARSVGNSFAGDSVRDRNRRDFDRNDRSARVAMNTVSIPRNYNRR